MKSAKERVVDVINEWQTRSDMSTLSLVALFEGAIQDTEDEARKEEKDKCALSDHEMKLLEAERT